MSEHIPYNWDDEDMCFMDEDEEDPHDVEVEREQIREANARNAMLQSLQAYLEQVREGYERAKKASNG